VTAFRWILIRLLDIRNYATVALEIANPVLKKPERETAATPPKKRGRRVRTKGGIA
jgi:hypothetical protein